MPLRSRPHSGASISRVDKNCGGEAPFMSIFEHAHMGTHSGRGRGIDVSPSRRQKIAKVSNSRQRKLQEFLKKNIAMYLPGKIDHTNIYRYQLSTVTRGYLEVARTFLISTVWQISPSVATPEHHNGKEDRDRKEAVDYST